MNESSTELDNITPAANHGRGNEYGDPPLEQGQRSSQDENQNTSGNPEFSLPPVDGGKDAWLFLAACFVVDALMWGYAFSFGVFQDYYDQTPPFSSSRNTATIGTSAVGVMYLASPLVLGLSRQYPRMTRYLTPIGLFLASLSLGLASLARSTTALILLQGILYAIGGAIAYCPTILYIDEWFAKRKGMAYGIVWSGEGLASVAFPLVLQRLLDSYGYAVTLRASGVAIFVLAAPLSIWIKPRVPVTVGNTPATRSWGLRFLFSTLFAPYQIGNLIQGTGYFLPSIYLPTYARTILDASGYLSALTVLLLNVSSTFGCVVMGTLTDRLTATTCVLISSAGATIGVLTIWGFSTTIPALYLFCVVYGLFAGSFTSTWPAIMRELAQKREAAVDPTVVFGWLCAGRGIGSLISGPLSDGIAKGMAWKGHASGGYGSGYGPLIAYTGITALLGSSCFMWKRITALRTWLYQ
ncbi:MFS general substrate transporter [Xylariaceae sp. FL0255]|nr:MFS general substrate transporter [Xylariaceae sp. FL0255]